MTGRRTSQSIKGLWTGLLTLLLFSASVNSESALNVTAASTHAAIIEEPRGNSTSDKIVPIVKSTSASLWQQNDESPEATLEAVKKIVLNSTSKSEGSAAHSDPVVKAEKLKISEINSNVRKIEVKRLVEETLPEFAEKDDYDEIHELDENDSREPTTPQTRKEIDKNDSSEKENEDEIVKKNPENNFSLINDTNVNYITKKIAKGTKDEDVYGNNYKNVKSTLENPTNVITSGDDQIEKAKGPKSQVEVIKNTTLPKILRLSEENVERKEEEPLEMKNLNNLPNDQIKMDNLTSTEIPYEKINDNKTPQTARARTISFGGTNEFLTELNKTGDSRHIFVATNSPVITEITEKSVEEKSVEEKSVEGKTVEEQKSTSFKPYPYLKITQIDHVPSNNTTSSAISLPIVPESTEEASALENTIGQSKEDIKIVVTEPSLVIDNSIQQFKSTYPKRSGNSSRTSTSLEPTFSMTPNLLDDVKNVTTESIVIMENGTTLFPGNFPVSNTENDVPRGNDESKSVKSKNTSDSHDLTGNGITEVMEIDKKNNASLAMEDFVIKTTTALPTGGNATTRVTEINLTVQNTTEKMATSGDDGETINADIKTEVDDSMVKISSFNVTEDSTIIITTETPSVKKISTQNSTISSNLTSFSFSSTKLEEETTTESPKNSGSNFTGENVKLNEFSSPGTSMDSTTSNVEYEFVGLTDRTVSQKYTESTESSSVLTDENGVFASSTSPPYLESSTPSFVSILSTPNSTSMEIETTVENLETSTFSGTSITEMESSEDSTTIFSTLDSNETEETITLPKESDESTTTNDFLPTEINELLEMTTEIILDDVTNLTRVTDILPNFKNSTDTGRSVDSSTNMPEISTSLGNSSGTFVISTESSNSSIVTDNLEFNETLGSSDEDSSSSISSIETTTMSIELDNTSESSSTSENSINIVTANNTEPDSRAVSPDDLTSLVRIIFEGNWADVCPHLPALRQSLADLLTSGLDKIVLASQIIFQKNPCTEGFTSSTITTELSVTTILLYVVDKNGNFDAEMTKVLPTLYSRSPIKLQVTIHSFQLVQDADSGNAIAVVVVSCVAFICLVLLAGLLFIMRKRQTRFNYGERCRPVSLDAYSLDSVSAYNSVRGRKGAVRASKRSYGNPTFEDSTATPSHPLNFAGLSTFCNEQNTIAEEFSGIPQVTARIDELPQGAEVKNRYANVVPLPETRVSLMKINNDPLTEYINASYVRGPKNATKYYIACQGPIESTVTDFWRMIWEQQSKVIIMLTDLVENGVEKCAEYLPPSEVTDCHRLFGDFQVTLKKRETKEKYAISTLHLKNLENNTFREISHIWYLWPANGVQSDAAGLIAVLLEARALQRGGPGPVVVHCSPGTGRTGTLIALDLGIRQYEITRTVDVPRVVYTIRRDRAGAVQTKEQYAFIYKALNLYATKLAGGALES